MGMKIRRGVDLELEGRLLIVPEQIELVVGASWSECDGSRLCNLKESLGLRSTFHSSTLHCTPRRPILALLSTHSLQEHTRSRFKLSPHSSIDSGISLNTSQDRDINATDSDRTVG